jgi:hypothetical protein
MVRPFGRSQPNLDLDLTALEGHESKRSTFVVLAESLSRRPSWFWRSKNSTFSVYPNSKVQWSLQHLHFCRPCGAHGMK